MMCLGWKVSLPEQPSLTVARHYGEIIALCPPHRAVHNEQHNGAAIPCKALQGVEMVQGSNQ